MSRSARAVIAGLATAGVLALGAGVAYADEPGDGHHDGSNGTSSHDSGSPDKSDKADKAPSADSSSQDAGGGLPGADMLGGLLGSLPIGL